MQKQKKIKNQNNIDLANNRLYLDANININFRINADRFRFMISQKICEEKDINQLMENLKWKANCAIEDYLENNMPLVLDLYPDFHMFKSDTSIKDICD